MSHEPDDARASSQDQQPASVATSGRVLSALVDRRLRDVLLALNVLSGVSLVMALRSHLEGLAHEVAALAVPKADDGDRGKDSAQAETPAPEGPTGAQTQEKP